MVVFYLQCIGFVPVLQCPQLIEEHDCKPDLTGNWHNVNGLNTFYLKKEQIKRKIWECSSEVDNKNMAMLLYGFFRFYSHVFPQQTMAASIRFGKCSLQKTSFHQTSKLWRLCLEDPFETCNSHCPHDLGCHVKEEGQKKINEHLTRATKELAALMQQTMLDDSISTILCGLLGPMPNNRKSKRSPANVTQPKHYQQQNTHHQPKRGAVSRGDHPNVGAKGRRNWNNQQHSSGGKSHKEIQRSHGDNRKNNGQRISTARSQMKGGSVGTNDLTFFHAQKMKGERGVNTKNTSRPSNHSPQANNPAANKKFIEQQKERLQQISKKKNSTLNSRRNKKAGNCGNDAAGEKIKKHIGINQNQDIGVHNQKSNRSKSIDMEAEM
eukprot:CAMPEP_0172567216 /NCGR_PEP_ID=MMETSP1067-20121228/115099_1 /TAXON_ID=265564 ORGANISM="Thalassiosira punctigera, Strain Tpunct2005C2" /NCGR_SAMPLE_ID=MMETSP1067 /ASSEMBLY_ACC=CAM_ASM_000444 /LENGTH=379 /DNA_ID=CAMNT_0013358513 /DNA_START=102 /DNA_END=1241 /DNA_ORIENTATION=-